MLVHLNKALEDAGKTPVAALFDLMVGTSTGSIVTAALAASTHEPLKAYADPKAIVAIYQARGREIFPKSLWTLLPGILRQKYSSDPIRRILTDVFGDMTLGQLKRNFMATFYSMRSVGQSKTPNKPRTVFAHGGDNYPPPGPGQPAYEFYGDVLLREAVQASTSAPTFFNPTEVRDPNGRARRHRHGQPIEIDTGFVAIDGGVFANTPSVCAYVEARKLWPEPGDEIIVVSVGCGQAETIYPSGVKTWGLAEWISPGQGVPLMKAVGHGQTDSANHQMECLLPARHFRLQFSLQGISKEMDDASEKNINDLIRAADLEMAKPETQDLVRQIVALAPPKPEPEPPAP